MGASTEGTPRRHTDERERGKEGEQSRYGGRKRAHVPPSQSTSHAPLSRLMDLKQLETIVKREERGEEGELTILENSGSSGEDGT